jgi:hypothetical protein
MGFVVVRFGFRVGVFACGFVVFLFIWIFVPGSGVDFGNIKNDNVTNIRIIREIFDFVKKRSPRKTPEVSNPAFVTLPLKKLFLNNEKRRAKVDYRPAAAMISMTFSSFPMAMI